MVENTGTGSRRNWLLRILNASFAVTLGFLLYPVVRFLWPRPATTSGAEEISAPFRVNELKNGPQKPFNFGGKPCLVVLTPGGAKRLQSGGQLQSGDVKAFNAVCTHVECTVRYRAEKGDIFCACHNGVYDLEGHNVSGPPPRPLEVYTVTLRGEPGQEEIVVSRTS